MPTVKFRRMDAFPFFLIGLIVAGVATAVALNGVHGGRAEWAGFCAPLLLMVLYYLDGPAAYIEAGPSSVAVGGSFLRYEVPRSRAPKIESPHRISLMLVLDDGSAIPLRVFEKSLRLSDTTSIRRDRGLGRIRAVLDRPPAPVAYGPVRRHVRWGSVALLLLPFVLAAALPG